MSTRTPATEGQAKIQDALRNGMYYAQRAMDHDSSLGKMKSADEAEAAFDRMAAARIIAQGIAQAPQSSPAPSVIEAGDAMENMMRRLRTQRDDEGILPTGNDFNGMDGLCAAWVAAKASRPSRPSGN